MARFGRHGRDDHDVGCGACCGTSGVIPGDNATVLSTANRNFKARMGNATASIYLASPAACAAAAVTGRITDARSGGSGQVTTRIGRARRLGDNINTDYIITSTRKRETLDTSILKQYLLETLDPAFAASVRDGDILVAGRNFGCGSAMEIAATVILASGIRTVVAESFSRTFYRNAINNALLPVVCDTSRILDGQEIAIQVVGRGVEVVNHATGETMSGGRMGGLVFGILDRGGLVPYVRQHGGLGEATG